MAIGIAKGCPGGKASAYLLLLLFLLLLFLLLLLLFLLLLILLLLLLLLLKKLKPFALHGLLVICALPSLFSLVDFEDKLSTNAQEKPKLTSSSTLDWCNCKRTITFRIDRWNPHWWYQ